MPARLSSRLSAAAVAAAILITACAPGSSASGTKPTPQGSSGPSMSAEIPPNLTDTWLAEAFLPRFWGRQANEGAAAPSVERVGDKPGPQAPFFGTPEVKGAACKRWAGGLRHAARDLARLDDEARIGGASYGGMYQGKPFIMGAALMVARPPLLDALAKDPLAGCRKAQARVSMGFSFGGGRAEQTNFRWVEYVAEPLPNAAPLGDWSAAYRHKGEDDAWTWVKEVRFGPYLLQVSLLGYIPIVSRPEQAGHINLAKLDEAAATAYDHARKVLAGPSPVPSISYPPPQPTPAPMRTVSRADLRSALLTESDGARGGAPFPDGLVTGPLRHARLDPDRRWLRSFGYAGPDGNWCEPYAKTLWYAVDDEDFWFKEKKYRDSTTLALTSLRGPGRRFITETILQADDWIVRVVATKPEWCESFTAKVGGRETKISVKRLWATEKSWAFAFTREGRPDAPTHVAWERVDDEHLIEIRLGTVGLAEDSGVTPGRLQAIADDAVARLKRHLR